MIKYEAGTMGLLFILRCTGSVFPKALLWAIPNAILAVILHTYCRQDQTEGNTMSMTGVDMLWTGYTSVLGFLVVFRNNQAYTRFWEGATLINQVRGEWFNAVSTLFAFCNHSPEKHDEVEHFQHTLVRLASMLYCSALQQVCALNDDCLEIIEIRGMDQESIKFMQESNDRCEVLLQWMQRLIVDAHEANIVKIAPPLLTRAFQELSRGVVNLNNARKIKDIPFPFPYAQMITCMLIIHWIATPLIASQVLDSRAMTGAVCFLVTFAFWCLIYIALEIDQPFGEDANDLPIREMQKDFNYSLLTMMHPLAQKVPTYAAREEEKPELKSSLSKVIGDLAECEDVHRLGKMMNACAMSAASMRVSTQSLRSDEEEASALQGMSLHNGEHGHSPGSPHGTYEEKRRGFASLFGGRHTVSRMALRGQSVVSTATAEDSGPEHAFVPSAYRQSTSEITTTTSGQAYRECSVRVRNSQQQRATRRVDEEASPAAPPDTNCEATPDVFNC